MEPCRGFAEEVGAVRHPDERGFTEGHVFWHADARRAGLLATIDRIRDPPTAQELKRHAERSSMQYRVLDKLPVFQTEIRALHPTFRTLIVQYL
jgi:hypothetical protein